jgi:hypothetical protein
MQIERMYSCITNNSSEIAMGALHPGIKKVYDLQIKRIHSWISLEGPLSAPITNKSPEGGAFLLLFGLKSRLSLYTRAQILKLEAVDRDLELPMCYY